MNKTSSEPMKPPPITFNKLRVGDLFQLQASKGFLDSIPYMKIQTSAHRLANCVNLRDGTTLIIRNDSPIFLLQNVFIERPHE